MNGQFITIAAVAAACALYFGYAVFTRSKAMIILAAALLLMTGGLAVVAWFYTPVIPVMPL